MWQYSNYSKINPEVERHFPFKSPRHDQLETISEIVDAISRGYKYIVLEAGTGTGKSAIAATLASMHESSYILTVTKQLQEQYLNDFNNLVLVKGRNNFTCNQDSSLQCDEGKCILEGFACEDSENTCDYYLQKNIALNSKTVISNYHYMFLELNYVNDFTKRELMICDEAHNLENTMMKQLTLEFCLDDLKDYLNLEIGDDILYELDNGDFDVWIQFITEIKHEYQREFDKIKDVYKPQLIEKIMGVKWRFWNSVFGDNAIATEERGVWFAVNKGKVRGQPISQCICMVATMEILQQQIGGWVGRVIDIVLYRNMCTVFRNIEGRMLKSIGV